MSPSLSTGTKAMAVKFSNSVRSGSMSDRAAVRRVIPFGDVRSGSMSDTPSAKPAHVSMVHAGKIVVTSSHGTLIVKYEIEPSKKDRED